MTTVSKFPVLPLVALIAAGALAGCTTTGTGVGDSGASGLTATFSWKAQGARTGEMMAQLSNGQNYTGTFFQITSETRVDDLGPLWAGWGPMGGGFYGRRGYWRGGWGGWGGWGYWGPSQEFLTHYSGKVLANLTGPDGRMRCRFTLIRPSGGMGGGGEGQCQLPGGGTLNATFAPSR
ncbi:hypothetical protein [uncultured Sphingomonas sp.]|uniref:hypothetical protein n=1 Tax=uncultured Sphingomonas sp. TaxID=158754 RepID=UPI0026163DFE|nr:hypothetical protein [uncultured Sphingomonas sp.]